MFKSVKVDNGIVVLDPSLVLAEGGEAVAYHLGSGHVLKIYKTPDHPSYTGLPTEQKGAKLRIERHQKKLPDMTGMKLPIYDVGPISLAHDSASGVVAGYKMLLVNNSVMLSKFGSHKFKRGVSNNRVSQIFTKLWDAVESNHTGGIVIGDFTPYNVLVDDTDTPRIIDIDSAQFGAYICDTFTDRYVDPTICKFEYTKTGDLNLQMIKRHSAISDWYSYCVMLLTSLLAIDPYEGVYRGVTRSRREERISIFHKDVGLPTSALNWNRLSDDMVSHLSGVIDGDKRIQFPKKLLGDTWKVCPKCNKEYARSYCPECTSGPPPQIIKLSTVVTGTVKVITTFTIPTGSILAAKYHAGKVRLLYHDGQGYYREDRGLVMNGSIVPGDRYVLSGDRTIIGRGSKAVVLEPGYKPSIVPVDTYDGTSVIDGNGDTYYYTTMGQLYRYRPLAPELVSAVIPRHTNIWCGDDFGFGFYKVDVLSDGFIFGKSGVIDGIRIPPFYGQIVASECYFSDRMAWLFLSVQEGGKTVNKCMAVRSDGQITGYADSTPSRGDWLSSIYGKVAYKDKLLSATKGSPVILDSSLVIEQEIPYYKPYIDTDSLLLSNGLLLSQSIIVVTDNEVKILEKI